MPEMNVDPERHWRKLSDGVNMKLDTLSDAVEGNTFYGSGRKKVRGSTTHALRFQRNVREAC